MKQKSYERKSAPAEASPALLIPPHILRFMNSLPVSGILEERIRQTKEALRYLLGDVDRIALFVNINCNLLIPMNDRARFFIVQAGTINKPIDVNATVLSADYELSEIYLNYLRGVRFPFPDYQAPSRFIYFAQFDNNEELPGNHLGAIFLFQLRDKRPISLQLLEVLNRLRPFVTFLLSDLVIYHQCYEGKLDTFGVILFNLFEDLRLTAREREVLTLRLLGFQKKAIADKLFLSQETISKHIQKILRKGKARTFIELFMRQYVPDLETMTVPSPTVRRSSRKGAKSVAKESPAREQNNLLIW